MQTCLDLYQGPDRLRALDNLHRLARYLSHAAKTGVTPTACKATLLALEVAPDHPYAVPVRLRCPNGLMPQVVPVDTSRLPADHGRVDRAQPSTLVAALQRIERMAETGEYGIAAVAHKALAHAGEAA